MRDWPVFYVARCWRCRQLFFCDYPQWWCSEDCGNNATTTDVVAVVCRKPVFKEATP